MQSKIWKFLAVLLLINFVDAVTYMAVAPSLIFYVFQVGGNKEQYGLMMSIFSFACFLGKPVYGYWVDMGGNKFRAPYIASSALGIVGALVYFLAGAFKDSTTLALGLILGGRFLSGLGAANQALGYAYIANAFKQEEQTWTNSALSMSRVLGMALGPAANILLAKVDTTLTIGNNSFHIDPLNSVGLALAIGNAFVLLIVFLALEEPPEKEFEIPDTEVSVSAAKPDLWKALFCLEIQLPLFVHLVFNSSYQL
jgi:MFS family permease